MNIKDPEKLNLFETYRAVVAEAKKAKKDDEEKEDKDEKESEDDDSDEDDNEKEDKSEDDSDDKEDKKDKKKAPPFVKEDEEVEELDEISKETLKSYRQKAYDAGDKADRDSDESMRKASRQMNRKTNFDGDNKLTNDGADKVNIHVNKANSLQDLKVKRYKGAALASKKLGELEMQEETEAMASLKPKSKIGMVQQVISTVAGMSKQDLSDWYDKSMAQFGPGKTYGVGDNSAKNAASIDMKASAAGTTVGPKTKDAMPKLNVKEDIDEMFAGQDLSEEFKENATTIFEAAVNARIATELVKLEEASEIAFAEVSEAIREEISDQVEVYINEAASTWMEENQVAIESTLRNEIMEEFISGLKNLFAENYIDIPEDKVDVLEALAEKVEALEQKLDESILRNSELEEQILENNKEEIFAELASDLALTQREKFASFAEGVEFDGNLETFSKKLTIIKEQYFKNKTTSTKSNIEEETFDGETNEINESVDPVMSRYMSALSKVR